MTDAELDMAYRNRASLPPAERAAVERAHAKMLQRYNSQWGTPDNVNADLDAAATPVLPDPALQAPPAAPPKMVPVEPETVDPQAAYAQRMIDAGFTPDEARVGAEYESRQAGAFDPRFSSDETLRAGAARRRQAAASWDALEGQLDMIYGPRPQKAAPAPRRSEGRVPRHPEDYRMGGAGTRGVPGPRTDDGRPATLPPVMQDAEEAAEYYVRPRDPETGELLPSRADEAMMARGFVPVYTPDGDISYSLASDYDGPGSIADKMSPNAIRRAGTYVGHNIRTADGTVHENVMIGADNRPIYDPATGKPKRASWETVAVRTPFGERSVLRLTDEARQAQAERANREAAARVGARIGQNPQALLDPAVRGEAMRAHSERTKQERLRFLANRNMLAGGSHNVNAGNVAMYNQLAMMSPEEQIRQLQYALPGGDLRAQVDARQLDTAARLAQNAVTGALAGTAAGPLAQRQAEALDLANDAKRAEQRAGIEEKLAEQYAQSGWFGYDEFTIEEQQQMIDTLMNVHGYSLPEAQAAVDRIADERRATQKMPRPGRAEPAGA